ncbi:transcriptional regulator [Amylibacter ulvae]|uniref:Transcriptional regulator n=1 Tax=Paramylibacter ulvae TaxID=1651968 RepID=A0ABQ3CV07_9RHOB|nr:GntR family transcriptional regulator [Amylibacter ulvae]GHA44148.1 transcriptional regulator [Amylibacter ulvae]
MKVKELFNKNDELSRRPSLGEEAADKLRDMILTEKYPAGEQLPETELADALGISRTPLRDALRILVSEGLVVHQGARRTFYVADPTIDELAADLSVIGALEGLAGEQACANASDEMLAEIQTLNTQMQTQKDTLAPVELFTLDMTFHCKIVEAAGNPSLTEAHRQFNARLWRARFVSAKTRSRQHNQQNMHQRIVDALMARDAQGASDALRQHMNNAVDNIKLALAERNATLANQSKPN